MFNKSKIVNDHRTARTDRGGDLGRSSIFQKMVDLQNVTLELTESDASAQNGVAKSPSKYLGKMMCCLLHSAKLGPEYWSYTLIHTVYIKNRLSHTLIQKTPFEVLASQ